MEHAQELGQSSFGSGGDNMSDAGDRDSPDVEDCPRKFFRRFLELAGKKRKHKKPINVIDTNLVQRTWK